MARHAALRASDADREAVAERLRHAAVEGRLEPDELEERLHAALRARTYGDLGRLLADLPAPGGRGAVRRVSPAPALPMARTAFAVAIRVAFVLALVAAATVFVATLAVWWIVCALIWLSLRAGRGGGASWRARPARRARLL